MKKPVEAAGKPLAMGHAMGQVQSEQHDGDGQSPPSARPFMVFAGSAFAQQGGGMGSGGMDRGMQSGMQGGGMHQDMERGGATGQQHMMGQGMANNMGMMSQMMNEMHQMMAQGQMTGEHQQQMMEMMNQMGQMMQEMSGPRDPQLEQQHRHQLGEMQKRLDGMKGRT